MKNREQLNNTCTYDILVNMANNVGICPLQAVAGIPREEKIMRCFNHIQGGCEPCIQQWLNEDINNSTVSKKRC